MGPGHFRPGDGLTNCEVVCGVLVGLQWGRGIFAPETVLQAFREAFGLDAASMGPGHFRPGDARICQGVWPSGGRFNGAGAFSPRRPATVVFALYSIDAASMGPGHFRPGDSARGDFRGSLPGWASMGPGHFRPGDAFAIPASSERRGAASMGPGHFRPGDAQDARGRAYFHKGRFNGAGAFSPRRHFPCAIPGGNSGELQWGRGIFAPETGGRAAG